MVVVLGDKRMPIPHSKEMLHFLKGLSDTWVHAEKYTRGLKTNVTLGIGVEQAQRHLGDEDSDKFITD